MKQSLTQQDQASKRTLIPVPFRIILGLIYTASVLIAIEKFLVEKLAVLEAKEVFSSGEAALVFLRVGAVGWALLFTLFQGIVLAVLFAISTGATRPRTGESWGYVLAAQIPFSLVVFAFLAMGKPGNAAAVLQEPYWQHTIGILTVIVFAMLAAVGKKIMPKRLIAFIILAAASNSAMLLLSSQVIS